jgi:hypothetical protein
MQKCKILHFQRQGASWRINNGEALDFTEKVCLFFKKNEELKNIKKESIRFLEIDYTELIRNCTLFSFYSPNPDVLWLIIITEQNFFWAETGDYLKMDLCLDQDGIERMVKVCIKS